MRPINPFHTGSYTRAFNKTGTHTVEVLDSVIVRQVKEECAKSLAKAAIEYRKELSKLRKENSDFKESYKEKIEKQFLVKELDYRKQIEELQTKLNIASNLKLDTFLEERGYLFTSGEIDKLLTKVLDH